jgi:hypothetical protein
MYWFAYRFGNVKRFRLEAFGKGTASEIAERLTNACNTVEERRFSAA